MSFRGQKFDSKRFDRLKSHLDMQLINLESLRWRLADELARLQREEAGMHSLLGPFMVHERHAIIEEPESRDTFLHGDLFDGLDAYSHVDANFWNEGLELLLPSESHAHPFDSDERLAELL